MFTVWATVSQQLTAALSKHLQMFQLCTCVSACFRCINTLNIDANVRSPAALEQIKPPDLSMLRLYFLLFRLCI